MFHSFSYGNITSVVSYSVWFTDITKTKKIFDVEYTNRNSRKQAEKIIYNVYNVDGLTIKKTVTDIVTYVGVIETTRVRTVT